MNFPADAPVTPEKKDALRARITALRIDLGRVDAVPVKGSGPGGQKMNKTSSGVQLRYLLGLETIVVKWTRERSQALNRFLGLRELVDEIEVRVSPATSERLRDRERIRRSKDRARRRSPRSPPESV